MKFTYFVVLRSSATEYPTPPGAPCALLSHSAGRAAEKCIFANVGRGGVVDEEALVESLKERRIAGAALDVFRTEPLPPSNPLWDLPNLLIGHNTAALSEKENERIVALLTLFKEDLGRYLEGEPLINRLDPELFYTASLRARGGAGMKYAASATRRRRSPTGPHTTEDIPPST